MSQQPPRPTDDQGDQRADRPRWVPEPHELAPGDVPHARMSEASDVSPTLLGGVDFRQHVAATLLVGRVLRDEHDVQVAARRHDSGVLLLEHEADGRVQRGFVVASPSSMEPRPIWPALLPLAVTEATPIDWMAAVSVPKIPALEQLDEQAATAYVCGWLPADDIVHLPLVTLEPHLGHEFEARYRQAKYHQLRPLANFPASR